MTSISTNQFGSGGSNGGSASRPHGRDIVIWTEEMNEYLIDALLHQQDIGKRSAEGRFMTVAYESVITGVGERFGVGIDRSNIKNRLKHVKDMFHECENLFDKESGIKWNPATRRFHADPQVWRELIEKKPEAKKWMTKTIDHYDRLLELFGKDRERRERPPGFENSKGPSKKKARIEPPKDRPQRQQTSSNGSELAIVQSSNQVMDKNELPGDVVAENNFIGELDLSELCKSENGLVAIPVHANAYGKGLPYAPENWPSPGDQWQWKVGNRIAAGGHWVDRYLAPPSRFRDATGKKTSFTSRIKVGEFIKSNFPDVEPSTFFSMFIWKIPAAAGGGIQRGTLQVERVEPEDDLADPDGPCKARNKACNLGKEGFIESSPAGNCDICCVHPDFCRTCCCILCGKAVNNSFGGYSYIKCEAVVVENYICGHLAHLDCALRIFMAGTVGGSIGLDVQYYCRRCDNKTNLMMHVEKLLETCRSLGSRSEIEPILNMGLCILRGSRQVQAKSLEDYMASVLAKVNNGVDLAEVWNMEDGDGMPILNAEESSPPIAGVTVLGAEPQYPYLTDPMVDNELQRAAERVPIFITGDHTEVSLKFEDEIDNSLLELKRSQEAEYRLAEQKLYSQKDYVLSLYRQLESDRSQLADPNPLSDISGYSVLLSNITNRVEQVKREEEKFQTMLKVSKGFRKAPASVKEHFGLPPAE